MFNSSELSTAVKCGINVTTIVFRNDSYGNVARDLDEMFGGAYETDLHNPDFVKFAESFGAVGMRADDPLELETLIPQAMESQGAGGDRRALRRYADTARPANCVCLQPALDTAPGWADTVLSGCYKARRNPLATRAFPKLLNTAEGGVMAWLGEVG